MHLYFQIASQHPMCFHCDSHCPLCFHIVIISSQWSSSREQQKHTLWKNFCNSDTKFYRNLSPPDLHILTSFHRQQINIVKYNDGKVNLKKKEGAVFPCPNDEASGRGECFCIPAIDYPCNRSAPAVSESLIEFLTPTLLKQPFVFKYHNPFKWHQYNIQF